jgi:hypothetical protein
MRETPLFIFANKDRATEPVHIRALAAHYRQQVDTCLRMAEQALSPYDEEWLRIAAKWTRLARQAEVKGMRAPVAAEKN